MSPSPRSGRRGRRGGSQGSRRRPGASSRNQPAPLTPTEDPPDIESFEEWELGEDIQSSIRDMDIHKPTPIQALAIGEVLGGRDVIAKAETGTGKTLAFGAPLMARIDPARSSVLGLVLSPTRELSEQVYNVLEKLGKARGVQVALVVGGEPLHPQVKALQAGAQVVVATPGRVIDLMGQGFLSFPWTEFVVLDEADKMLEIGFIDDVRKILEATDPDIRQTLLFSATFPPPLLELAREHTRNPAEMATASGVATVDTIEQTFLRCDEEDRARALSMMIENSDKDDVFLIFCERRTDVDRMLRRLERLRFSIKALHGGYDQPSRFRVMSAFRTGEVKALLATDVASRGLDVQHVTHVINVGVPRDVSDYTHRIGRTGRAGRQGVACTLVSRRDDRNWKPLLSQTGFDIRELSTPRELAKIGRGSKPEAAPEEAPEEAARKAARDEDSRGSSPRGRRRTRDDGEGRSRKERPSREERGRSREEREPREERSRRRRAEEGERETGRRERRSSEEERPRSRRRREERGGADRARAPRRTEESQERPRRERDDEPRRSRSRKAESGSTSSGEPRRERPREQKESSRPSSGGFGAGLSEERPPRQKKKQSAGEEPRKRAPRKPSQPSPARDEGGASGGFGAGL